MMLPMGGLAELRVDGRMTWREAESGWIAASRGNRHRAFAREGFEECKREMTTSRRDRRPGRRRVAGAQHAHGVSRVRDLGESCGLAAGDHLHHRRRRARQGDRRPERGP